MSPSTATSKDRINGVGLKANSTLTLRSSQQIAPRLTSRVCLGLRYQLLGDRGHKVLDVELSLRAKESANRDETMVYKAHFEIRDMQVLLDGGIYGVVHFQIRVMRDDRHTASSPSHPTATRKHEQLR